MPYDIRVKKTRIFNFLIKIYTNINNQIIPKLQYIQEFNNSGRHNYQLNPLQETFIKFHQHKDNIIRVPKYPIFSVPWNQITHNRNIFIEDINIDLYEKRDKFKIWLQESKIPDNYINHIFTDGSKKQEGVGAAIYSLNLKLSQTYKLPENRPTSIFTAEAFVIS